MKLEIEISESEIKDALARHVRAAIADRVNAWGSKHELDKFVRETYEQTVRKLVVEMLNDAPTIREQIRESMVNKIRGQLTAAMKEKK